MGLFCDCAGCPRCGKTLYWDYQDDIEIDGKWHRQRVLVCEIGGCWEGPLYNFPCRGKPEWVKNRDGELPEDPGANTVPMDATEYLRAKKAELEAEIANIDAALPDKEPTINRLG